MGDIHPRVSLEIPRSRIRRGVEQLVKDGKLVQEECSVAHVTASPNLARDRAYQPVLSQTDESKWDIQDGFEYSIR